MSGGEPSTSAVVRHNVTVSGPADGPVMLFLHGFGMDQRYWQLVAPSFAADRRIVLMDLMGTGGSDTSAYDPERYASLDGYASDVLDVITELDLTDVTFVGHSVSAMIGLLASIREPERFSMLVLVGPSPRYLDDDGYVGGFSQQDIDELFELLDSNYTAWSSAMGPVIMGNADRPELGLQLTSSFTAVDQEIARQFARVTFLSDNRADLPRVTTPCLVLQCAEDVIAPTAVGRYMHDHLPHSTFVQLRATGHCPNISAPEELVDVIMQHLRASAGV